MQRMTPLDASFLHLESATSQMHIGSIAIMEGPPPAYADVARMVAGKLPHVPRYRQVACTVPLHLGRPVWADDPNFDIGHHVRHTTVDRPGDDERLCRLVGRLMGQPLDRSRPLWEIWMVDGLGSDRWALVSKTHHSMVDGVSGAELLGLIFDLAPEGSPPAVDTWRPAPLPSAASLTRDALADLMLSPYEQFRAVRAALRRPREVLARVHEVTAAARSASSAVRSAPQSSLNGPIGADRRWTFARASVADVREARAAHGGTFNDVVLAAITNGFRELLLGRGESTSRVVRTMVPVSVRPRNERGTAVGDGQLANRVSAMFADLPVHAADPVDALRLLSDQLDGLKESRQAVAGEALIALTGFAMPALFALGARAVGRAPNRAFNTVTTNVPGPQFPLYAAGRRCLEMFPYVPIGVQIRVAVAIFSYAGTVGFGITGDEDTTADLDAVATGIESAMRRLTPPPKKAGKRARA